MRLIDADALKEWARSIVIISPNPLLAEEVREKVIKKIDQAPTMNPMQLKLEKWTGRCPNCCALMVFTHEEERDETDRRG